MGPTRKPVVPPQSEWDVRSAAILERLEREPVAWLFGHEGDEPLDTLDDAWSKGQSHWAVFSVGHFFEIAIARGRVVARSSPGTGRGIGTQIGWWLQRPRPVARLPSGPEPPLVAIPGRMRGEILRKTDTKGFPQLLETCRITVIGQMTTGMPVAASSFGPVDRRQDPQRWDAESKALMALLSEPLTTREPILTIEDFRSIRFEDRE